MTSGACAARVERRLNRIDGVSATVNFATEKASVAVSGRVGPAELITAIEEVGYGAELPAVDPDPVRGADPDPYEAGLAALRMRLLASLALSVPDTALAMVPAA